MVRQSGCRDASTYASGKQRHVLHLQQLMRGDIRPHLRRDVVLWLNDRMERLLGDPNIGCTSISTSTYYGSTYASISTSTYYGRTYASISTSTYYGRTYASTYARPLSRLHELECCGDFGQWSLLK